MSYGSDESGSIHSEYSSIDHEMCSLQSVAAGLGCDEEESLTSFPEAEELIHLVNKGVAEYPEYIRDDMETSFTPESFGFLEQIEPLFVTEEPSVEDEPKTKSGREAKGKPAETRSKSKPKQTKNKERTNTDPRFQLEVEINENDIEPESYAMVNPTKLSRSTARIVRALQLRGRLDINDMMVFGQCDQKRVYDIANVLVMMGLVTRDTGSKSDCRRYGYRKE